MLTNSRYSTYGLSRFFSHKNQLKNCRLTANRMPHQTNDETTNQPENGTSTRSTKPVTTFGLLTDIQYADVEDGMSYDKTRHRYYRNSLNLVSEAVKNWKQHEIDNEVKLQFLLQLGDIVDLQAFAKNESEISLDKVMSELNKLFPVPVDQDGGAKEPEQKILHLWGNHEMYNWRRKGSLAGSVLNTARRLQQEHVENTNCFVYEVTDKLRLVCLDFYKSAIIGYEETDPEYVTALDYLRSHNKNEDLNSAEGGLGVEQLEWFGKQLEDSHRDGKKVIVCGHVPVHHQSSEHMCLAWDYKEVLQKMWSYEGTVLAYFAGHYHAGGYFRDKYNIHHITFHAVLETAPNSNSYATVKVFDDRVSVEGVGMVGYYDIFFNSE